MAQRTAVVLEILDEQRSLLLLYEKAAALIYARGEKALCLLQGRCEEARLTLRG